MGRKKVADHPIDLDQGVLMDDIFGDGAKEPAAQHHHDHPNREMESQVPLGREAGQEKGELGCEACTQGHHPRVRQERGLWSQILSGGAGEPVGWMIRQPVSKIVEPL